MISAIQTAKATSPAPSTPKELATITPLMKLANTVERPAIAEYRDLLAKLLN
jgi:hypothetical protein